ncbi:hypothetical protein Sjap_009569 [Stephania japonica]|uniref:BTB/POZ and TAZ domain-containing protein 3 n=1 Tax=Stephania japonica TaxID=461633 RepID=A0AAP0JTY9_9MAGN
MQAMLMAQRGNDLIRASLRGESFKDHCYDLQVHEGNLADIIPIMDIASTSHSQNDKIPKPPPPPVSIWTRMSLCRRIVASASCVPRETKDTWDKLFSEGYRADVCIVTCDQTIVLAHSSVLGVASPVLKTSLKLAKAKDGVRYIRISGVPSMAVRVFIRFLYSACYEEDELKTSALHLLVLSHCFLVPSLKRVCINVLEQDWLSAENVIDVLQLARKCDAPRLYLMCVRLIVKDFKKVCATEGWKVMKRVDPALEQELLEAVVEADSRKQERMKKIEEKKVYMELNEAMEAILHICRDGCRTIGPRDKVLRGGYFECGFPACKGIETLVRHFATCRIRVPGGCAHCKRMWQLFELHSRMCDEPDLCKVPLCRHFKIKMQQESKRDETRWRLLVSRITAAKFATMPFNGRRTTIVS